MDWKYISMDFGINYIFNNDYFKYLHKKKKK